MPDRFVLLDLAPWPTLLSLVRHAPRDWIVWGTLPRAVGVRLAAIGVEIRDQPLPQPFHQAELPEWIRKPHRGIVVPALGNPLPTRWPVVRRLATMDTPVFVARHGRIERVPEIPSSDAFTWALDHGGELAAAAPASSVDFACVRADLLGDVLLAVPALTALAATGSMRLIVREEWTGWMKHVLPAGCRVQGLGLAPWALPVFEPAATSVDLSPPGWRSPLTPAIARTIPAATHTRLGPGGSLSDMLAATLGLDVRWPARKQERGTHGVLVPTGSSLERLLPAERWTYAVERASSVMRIASWTILDPDGTSDPTLARVIPHASVLTGWQPPAALIDMIRSAAVVVGVSTALTHLAALTGTPALVVEHPTTVPAMYRAPVEFVRYLRSSRPWWRDDPSDDDVERAMAQPDDTYGFVTGEWRYAIDKALAHQPFAGAG